MSKVYKNSTPLMELGGVPVYMSDMADACMRGRLNLFLQGDTGSGKTQLAKDVMTDFGDKSLFILGRNDMDTRELFQQINLDKLRNGASSSEVRELTDRVNTNLIVVDELPNCVPAVRAQLFNLFDGFIEINGKPYAIGNGYSVGIATGNLGQKFTESANDLGRALKDRMHVIVDTDKFAPTARDNHEILSGSTDPRVHFSGAPENKSEEIIQKYKELRARDVPSGKILVANYLIEGMAGYSQGDKRKNPNWMSHLEPHEIAEDTALVGPLSIRGAKSTIRLSQALDDLVREKGGNAGLVDSMLQAYKFTAAYSGILNEMLVDANYGGDRYKAIDAVIDSTKAQFEQQAPNLRAVHQMASMGRTDEKILNKFTGRWAFIKPYFESLAKDIAGRK